MAARKRRAGWFFILPFAISLVFSLWIKYLGIRRRQKQAAKVLQRELVRQGLPHDAVKRISKDYGQPWSSAIFGVMRGMSRQGNR